MERNVDGSGTGSRRLKVGALIGGALILLVLLLLALGPLLFPTEQLRSEAVTLAEEALERPVEIGSIRIRLLPLSLTLGNVVIGVSQEDETTTPLEAERVTARIAPFPLLLRRIDITRIVIRGGLIRLERMPDGSFAATDLLELPEPPAEPRWDVGVGRVSFADIAIDLVDRHVVPGQVVVSRARNARGDLLIGSLEESLSLDIELALFERDTRNVLIRGKLPRSVPRDLDDVLATESVAAGGADATSIDLEIVASDVETSPLAPYVGGVSAYLPETLSLQLTLAGDPSSVVKIDGFLEIPPDIVLTLSGLVDLGDDPPRVEIDASLTAVEVDLLLSASPGLDGLLPRPILTDGSLGLTTRAAGPLDDLHLSGQAQSDRLRIEAGSFADGPARDGGLLMISDDLLATLEIRARGQRVPWMDVDIQSRRLDIDFKAEEEPPEAPPDLPRAVIVARIRADEGRLLVLEFQKLDAGARLAEGRLTFQPEMLSHEGSIQARLDSDLRCVPSSHRLELDVDSIDTASLIRELAPDLDEPVSGDVSVTMLVGWRGLDFEQFQTTAEGDGSVGLRRGRIATLDLEPDIAEVLREVAETIGVMPPQEFTEPTLRDLRGEFVVLDGAVLSEVMEVRGDFTRILFQGALGMDGSLSIAGSFGFSPDASDRFGPIGQLLRGPDDWLVVPFSIDGTAEEPDVSIDVGVLLRRAAEGLIGEPDIRWEELRRLWREQVVEPARHPG